MAGPPRDSNPHSGADEDMGKMPVWVKVFGIITIILVLLFVIVHLLGGGLHGHTP